MAFISNGNISAVQLAIQGSDPDGPDSGFFRLYAKADGLYLVDASDVVFGPFAPVSAASIGDLSDVDLTGLADGDVLVYDGMASEFVPGAGGGGGGGLSQAQVLARTLGA